MSEVGSGKIVVNCPGCGKEYNMDEYKKLEKAKPIVSVRGKNAPKEALAEIAERTGGVLHEGHVDVINNEIYDPRVCSKCGTEFGFVKIVGEDRGNTIFQIDLDLVEPKKVE